MKLFLTIIGICSLLNASAQNKTFYAVLNILPSIGYNISNSKGQGKTEMNPLAYSGGLSIGLGYSFMENQSLIFSVKYAHSKQRITQYDFNNYLGSGSKFFIQWGYANYDFNVQYDYSFYMFGGKFSVPIGLSYLIAKKNESHEGYSLRYADINAFRFRGFPSRTDWSAGINTFTVNAGFNYYPKIKRKHNFKIGVLFSLPFNNMPTYNFQSELLTDNGIYSTNTYTESKQILCEVVLSYRLFFKRNTNK